MAISFVGAASANADSLSLPSHQAGDKIVLFVYRSASTAVPSIPSGWDVQQFTAGGSNGLLLASKIAASSAETSGTWTGATQIAAGVYRGSRVLNANITSITGSTAGSGGNITYTAPTATSSTTEKWFIAAVGHRSNDTDCQVAPTGMTNRTSVAGASTGELAIHDTNGTAASWSTTSYTLTAGTSSGYRVIVVELTESAFAVSSGGGSLINSQQLVRQGWIG